MSKQTSIESLRIEMPEDTAAESLCWFGFDAAGALTARGTASLGSLPDHAAQHWIVPPAVIAGHVVSVPRNAGRHRDALISQALEDILLTPRDEAHVVAARADDEGQLVWVLRQQWLADWLKRWEDGGLRLPSAAFPIYDLLPSGPLSVFSATRHGVIFRTPAGQTGCLPDVSLVLDLLGSDARRVENLHAAPLPQTATNLLAGSRAAPASAHLQLSQFRKAGLLAGALAVTVLVGMFVQWHQLESRERTLQDEIRQTFAASFPGTPIVAPYAQWQSMQRERNAATRPDALDQLARIAAILPGIQPRNAEVRGDTLRLLLTEADTISARTALQRAGHTPNISPADQGFSRLDVRLKAPE